MSRSSGQHPIRLGVDQSFRKLASAATRTKISMQAPTAPQMDGTLMTNCLKVSTLLRLHLHMGDLNLQFYARLSLQFHAQQM